MPLISTPAVILQGFPYSETSKILRLLTPGYGVRSVVAKGARRPKSRFGGLLDPFTEGTAEFFARENRDLHTLTGFDLVRGRQGIGRDLGAFAGASLIAEIVLRTATEEPHEGLYSLVSEWYDRLADGGDGEGARLALAGVWQIVSVLGFRPLTSACVVCARALDPEEPSRFDMEAGGVACLECRPRGRIVDPASRRALELMIQAGRTLAPEADPVLHRSLLKAFLLTHLTQGQGLNSLELFLQQF